MLEYAHTATWVPPYFTPQELSNGAESVGLIVSSLPSCRELENLFCSRPSLTTEVSLLFMMQWQRPP